MPDIDAVKSHDLGLDSERHSGLISSQHLTFVAGCSFGSSAHVSLTCGSSDDQRAPRGMHPYEQSRGLSSYQPRHAGVTRSRAAYLRRARPCVVHARASTRPAESTSNPLGSSALLRRDLVPSTVTEFLNPTSSQSDASGKRHPVASRVPGDLSRA